MANKNLAEVAQRTVGSTSPSKVAARLDSLARFKNRTMAENKEMAERGMSVAIQGGTAIGSGILFQKFSDLKKIPGTEIDMQLALGVPLVIGGLVSKGRYAGAMMDVGMGLLLPWLYEKGEEIGAKMGS